MTVNCKGKSPYISARVCVRWRQNRPKFTFNSTSYWSSLAARLQVSVLCAVGFKSSSGVQLAGDTASQICFGHFCSVHPISGCLPWLSCHCRPPQTLALPSPRLSTFLQFFSLFILHTFLGGEAIETFLVLSLCRKASEVPHQSPEQLLGLHVTGGREGMRNGREQLRDGRIGLKDGREELREGKEGPKAMEGNRKIVLSFR